MIDEQRLTHAIELRSMMSVLWKASQIALDRWLAEHEIDISRVQLLALRMLAASTEAGQTLSDLSRAIGVDPSSLVSVVDALEQRGWIIRQRDPQDRRRVPLHVTPDGHRILAAIPLISAHDPLLTAIDGLGEADTMQLLRLLCRLVHQMPDGHHLLMEMETRLQAHEAKENYIICKRHQP